MAPMDSRNVSKRGSYVCSARGRSHSGLSFWLDWAPMLLLGLIAVMACVAQIGMSLNPNPAPPVVAGTDRPTVIVETGKPAPQPPVAMNPRGGTPSKDRNLPS